MGIMVDLWANNRSHNRMWLVIFLSSSAEFGCLSKALFGCIEFLRKWFFYNCEASKQSCF
jgi:hypothetical protein